MKQLNDIVLQPGTAAKYSLSIKITDVDEPENEDKGEGFLINGDDIARILAWAEWKLILFVSLMTKKVTAWETMRQYNKLCNCEALDFTHEHTPELEAVLE
jgi:hypothetical protein